MKDGLYIEGVYACEVDSLRFTFQGDDLTEPGKLQSSYTSSIVLPDSQEVRAITEGAQSTNTRSLIPYSQLKAFVIIRGQIVFRGLVNFKSFYNGWSVELTQEKKSIFDRMLRSIKTVDLSEYNFDWNHAAIVKFAKATKGVVFPLIDYGLISENKQPSDLILPSVYLKTILEKMLSEEGVSISGLDNFAEYHNLIIPFSNENPLNSDSDFIADRQARAGVKDAPPFKVERGGRIDTLLPFFVVDNPQKGFSQGKLNNFKPQQNGYKVDSRMRLLIDCSITYKLKISVGGVRVQLLVEKNGQEVFVKEFEEGAITDILYIRTLVLGFSTSVECEKGDLITIRLVVDNVSAANLWFFEAFQNDSMFVVFAPDPVVKFGDFFNVASNLPELTGIDLLKTVAFLGSGTWAYNERTANLNFLPFSPIVEGKDKAVDWSAKVDEDTEATLTPLIDPYARKNRLTWKPENAVPVGKTGYADGVLLGGAGEAETILFELPFQASQVSSKPFSASDTIVSIPIRVANVGAAPSVQNQVARLLLVHPTLTVPVPTTIKNQAGQYIDTIVNLRLAWFDRRPATMALEPVLSLDFAKLIGKYYRGLEKVLERPKTLALSMHLEPNDIASIDFGRLVYLQGCFAGYMPIAEGFYYLNQVDNYQDGQLSAVTLIRV